MKRLYIRIPASVYLYVEVADDASDDAIKAAVVEECPKYPEVKAGQNFDPEEYDVLDEERGSWGWAARDDFEDDRAAHKANAARQEAKEQRTDDLLDRN